MSEDESDSESRPESGTARRPGEELSVDAIYDLVTSSRRREVLSLFVTREQPLTLRDLTHGVAQAEEGAEITDISQERVAEIRITLYHVHLPKLAEHGVVSVDEKRDVVEPTENLDQFEPFLTQS